LPEKEMMLKAYPRCSSSTGCATETPIR